MLRKLRKSHLRQALQRRWDTMLGLDFHISNDDSIIDIGCGKGNVIRLFLGLPFKRVDGIEMSNKLAIIANRNFHKLSETRTTIFEIDASQFSHYENYNYIFFYDPFPSDIMKKVLKKL